MEPQPPLFREQALAHHLAGDSWRGDLLRISPLWSVWAFGFLVLAITCGLVFAAVTPVTSYASGPAVVRHPLAERPLPSPGSSPVAVLAVIPARYHEQLAPGSPLHFRASGSGEISQRLVVDEVSAAISVAEARRRLPAGLIDAVTFDGPVIVITARAPEKPSAIPGRPRRGGRPLASFPDGKTGYVRIPLGSKRLVWILLRPFLSADASLTS